MRYDATEFLRLRWRQRTELPRGTKARDFVGPVTGDPRPIGQSPTGNSSLDLGQTSPFPSSGLAHLSWEGR